VETLSDGGKKSKGKYVIMYNHCYTNGSKKQWRTGFTTAVVPHNFKYEYFFK